MTQSHCASFPTVPRFSFSEANLLTSATVTVGVPGALTWGPGYHGGVVGAFIASHVALSS